MLCRLAVDIVIQTLRVNLLYYIIEQMTHFFALFCFTTLLCLHPFGSNQIVLAQEQEPVNPLHEGMILEQGMWVPPTPESALRALINSDGYDTFWAVAAILNQSHKSYSPSELDAFADEVVRVFNEDPGWPSANAAEALGLGGRCDLIIDIYESNDQNPTRHSTSLLFNMLGRCANGGLDYLWHVFSTSEKPPVCNENPRGDFEVLDFNYCDLQRGTWCLAGFELIDLQGGPSQDDWDKRCYRPYFIESH